MALVLKLILDGDNAWEDMLDRMDDVIHVPPESLQLATLDDGMVSRRPSVGFRIDLPNHKVVFVETSVWAFLAAAAAIRAKYPDIDKEG